MTEAADGRMTGRRTAVDGRTSAGRDPVDGRTSRCRAAAALAVAVLLGAFSVDADAGILARLRGKATVQRAAVVLPATEGMELRDDDEVLTEEQSEVLLQFDDGSRVAMRPETLLKLHEVPGPQWPERGAVKARMVKGAIRYVSGRATVSRNVRVFTPTSTIGVRGTDFDASHVEASPSGTFDVGTYVRVNEGEVELAGRDATVSVTPGEVAVASPPGLTARGIVRTPLVRKVTLPPGLFQRGSMDDLLR
ncbi:FecR family protein [Ramlibacter albus]|uniref:FecR domain-containing protein n=1 Tax=Ramlibacter albus TaxID=2079448 RepID=A0A923S1S4_9BURK|nr:FecR domain-containing protein [Ramlibacter albus]MBC5764586.1 FecR domain-containing protein [Ramlibacter albus]